MTINGFANLRDSVKMRRAIVAITGAVAALSMLLWASFAFAGTGLSVTPNFPSTVSVGDTGVPVSLIIANASTSDEGVVTLSSVTLVPSCGDNVSGCTSPDPDVFAVSTSGTGKVGTSCAGDTFTITETNATTGQVTFTRTGGPLTLAFNASCEIEFTIDVLMVPTDDASGAAGIQTAQLGAASGTSALDNPATGTGADFTTVQESRIIVDKVTNPSGDTQSFSFDATGTGYQDFSLTDAAAPNDQVLTPGAYSISETLPAGWVQTSANCVSSIQDVETIGDLELDAGETITCTFTNTKNGRIIVDKVTDPSGSIQSFDFTTTGTGYENFSLTDAADPNEQEVAPGTYTVSETLPDGWTQTSATCDMDETPASLDVGPGETVTCTFTNTQESRIIVDKVTVPSGDTQSFSFNATGGSYQDFSLTDVADPNNQSLAPGDYSVAETLPDGWTLTSSSCVSSLGENEEETPADLELDAGETITCTFTNTKDARIIVIKQTDPEGSTTEFEFNPSWSDANFMLSDGEQEDSGPLAAGEYSVAEINIPATWELTSSICDGDGNTPADITLAAGQTVTCTFTNTQEGGRIIVVKQTDPDGSTQSFEFDTNYGNNFNLTDGQQNDSGELDPGTYSVAEVNLPAGWEQTSATCSDQSPVNAIVLSAGETVTCTFVNTENVVTWCSPGYWKNHLAAWAATGIATTDLYTEEIGPITLSKKGQKDGATTNPTLLQVVSNPQWYGGEAANNVGDLLSMNHPDVDFDEGDTRVPDSCPLN